MSKNPQLLVFFCLFFNASFSQSLKKETLAHQGSAHFVYANTKSYYIQESIGQASVIRTFNTQNYSLRQGFLQPVNASYLNDNVNSGLDALVFPNPFTQTVNIRFNEAILDVLHVNVSDMTGRIVYSGIYNPVQTLAIQLNDITSGVYLLQVRMRQKTLVSKIIRQ
ncbi:MAG: T9SS type A sorting domain-containing protein [Gelidibacter sp.]